MPTNLEARYIFRALAVITTRQSEINWFIPDTLRITKTYTAGNVDV
jgi:hypothetical protein